MSNSSSDPEMERIQKKKIGEMLERVQGKLFVKSVDKPLVLTDKSFQSEVAKHSLIVVDFWAPWCGPCTMVGPLIEQLAAEYSGKVAFGKMNVDKNQVVAGKFNVMSIPTLIVFKNGKAVESVIGACSKSHIESLFKRYMEKAE